VSGIATRLIEGVAQLLHDAGAVTWAPDDVWTAGPPPIFDTYYPDSPDVAATLATYYLGGDEPTFAGSMIMLQVKTRSSVESPAAGTDLDDAIAQVLLGNWPIVLVTGVTVSIIERASGTPIGRDEAGRHERTTNYRLTIHDPGPHRG
jgi:minor capsid protein